MMEGGLNGEEQAVQYIRVVVDQYKSDKTVKSRTFCVTEVFKVKARGSFHGFALNNFISLPVSATETVLLKYCSSTVHSVSFDFVVTPQKPLQFTLMAAEKNRSFQSKKGAKVKGDQ